MNIFILTLLISMAIIMFILLPILAAFFIYKDAKKYPELGSALMYALMALFIPLYLGIVYYFYKQDEYQTKKYNEEHPLDDK